MTLFNNKYRIESTRLPNWDYSNAATYFITICSKNREQYFGQIISNKMHLSKIGMIVKQEWLNTLHLRTDMNISLGEYVIMPNHFHAIVSIGKNKYNNVETQCIASENNTKTKTHINASLPNNKFGPQRKNLASIIRGFKSACTKQINQTLHNTSFAWQPLFHEHIIRDAASYQKIENYIVNNPSNWKEDVLYKEL